MAIILRATKGSALTHNELDGNFTDLDGRSFDNMIIVKTASDFGTIDPTKQYFVDGIINMTGVSLEIPAGGINITGHNFDLSQLVSADNTYTMFTSPVGGSGNVLMTDIAIDVSGTSSQVWNITGDTGFEAFEFSRINYNNCTSLGTITGYRQGLETGTGRFGGSPTLTLDGTWIGGYFIETSIVRSLAAGMSGALFEAGGTFSMASRFRSNQNIDLPASASFIDFAPSNFTNPSTVQLTGMLISRNGVFDASDSNLTPNIDASDLESSWSGNIGLDNTFVGGEATISSETTTTITTGGVFVDLAGTFTTSSLEHFDSPAAGQLRHLGDSPINYSVGGQLILECDANDDIALKIVVVRGGTPEDGKTLTRVVNNLQGGRDVAYFVVTDNITLNKNDYIKLQVANVTSPASTANITAEVDSFFTVQAR